MLIPGSALLTLGSARLIPGSALLTLGSARLIPRSAVGANKRMSHLAGVSREATERLATSSEIQTCSRAHPPAG
jgi:hypothetical protein